MTRVDTIKIMKVDSRQIDRKMDRDKLTDQKTECLVYKRNVE